MSLKPLPASTVKLLGSTQVITSVYCAVKELIENSIDAGSDCIEVRLENYGLDKLEVRDNGCGISREDVEFMCQRSYTSKISDYSDLDRLNTYGFRGEALSSLCSVGKLSVTTITSGDDVAKCYTMDTSGRVENTTLSHISKGTIIVVENLFRNLPVRRQLMSAKKRKTEEMNRIEGVVKCLAIVQPQIRITLAHNKYCIWQKNKVATLRQSLVQAIPPTMVKQLIDLEYQDEEVKIHMLIPRNDCNIHALCFGNLAGTFYLFINKRPVRDRQLDKMIQESIFQYFGHNIPAGKLPMCLVSIELQPHALDINLEPNKTKVIIKDMDSLIRKLKDLFLTHYIGDVVTELARMGGGSQPEEKSAGKRKNNSGKSPEVPAKLPKMNKSKIDFDNVLAASTQLESTVEKSSARVIPGLSAATDDFSNEEVSRNRGSDLKFIIERRPSSRDETEREKNIMAFLEGLPVQELFDEDPVEAPKNGGTCSTAKPFLDDIAESVVGTLQSGDEYESKGTMQGHPSFKVNTGSSDISRTSYSETERESAPSCNSNENIVLHNGKSVLSMPETSVEPAVNQGGSSGSSTQETTPNFLIKGSSASESSGGLIACSQECDVSADTGSSFGDEFLKDVGLCPPGLFIEPEPVRKMGMANTENISLSHWSRGDVKLNGEQVEGPGKILGQANCFKFGKSAPNNCFQEHERSVSSQMGCKKMSAFTKFAREMRSKILQEAPGMSFTKVASELASRWKNLQEGEREIYENLATEEKKRKTQEKRQSLTERRVDLTRLKVKCEISEEKKIVTALKRKQYCSTIPMGLSIGNLREAISRRLQSKKISVGPRLIGKSNNSLVYWGTERNIYAFSLSRLSESLCFFDNLANMTIPVKVLEESIELHESELGALVWNTLSCLETSVDISSGTIFVSDERIVKNGFRIEVEEGPGGKSFNITDVPLQIAYYGTEELKEVLEVIERKSFICNLENCRPLKAVSYIRSETIRQLSQAESKEDLSNIPNVINYWFTNIKSNTNGNCPHHNPVAKILRTI